IAVSQKSAARRRWVDIVTSFRTMRLAAVCVIPLLQPAEAQRCDGIDLEVGAHERRCLQPGRGEAFKDCPGCPEMVVVPAGSFTMGASPGEEVFNTEREDPVPVKIAQPFAVGRFAVTRGEFAAFSAATAHNANGGCYDISSSDVKGRAGRDWRSPGFLQD